MDTLDERAGAAGGIIGLLQGDRPGNGPGNGGGYGGKVSRITARRFGPPNLKKKTEGKCRARMQKPPPKNPNVLLWLVLHPLPHRGHLHYAMCIAFSVS